MKKARKVFLLTGFNNWGKTTLIQNLFNCGRFPRDTTIEFAGYDFCVIPQSNDDDGRDAYEAEVLRKMNITQASYIFSAFCPTREPGRPIPARLGNQYNPGNNLSADIIATLYKNDEIILIPIEYKWCNHAKLELSEIINYYGNIPNFKIEPLLGNNITKKLSDLDAIVRNNLP